MISGWVWEDIVRFRWFLGGFRFCKLRSDKKFEDLQLLRNQGREAWNKPEKSDYSSEQIIFA